MTGDLRRQLRDGDPLNSEPALTAADVQDMRRKIVSAAPVTAGIRFQWNWQLAIALVFICAIGTPILMRYGRRPNDLAISAPERAERRQLQFQTPGGTRINWVLNPELPF